MNSCKPIASTGALLLALFLCVCVTPVYADAAAEVLFSHGSVHATGADGQRRALHKGDDVFSGDTVTTAADGRVQMRFSDGGLVSLMPGSKFVVAEYQQPTSGGGGSLVFKLVEGGLRTLTGTIGHKDHDDYKLKTSVATLGIRGTQFVVVMDGDVMRIHVGHGKVAVFNDSGRLFLISGENGIVIPGKAPEKTVAAPNYVSSAEAYSGNALQDSSSAGSSNTTVAQDAPIYYLNNTKRGNAIDRPTFGNGGTPGGDTTPGGGSTPDGGASDGGDGNTLANPGFGLAYRPAGGAPMKSTSYSKQEWQQAIQDAGGSLPTSVPDFLPAKPDTPIADVQSDPPTVNKTGGLVWGEVLTDSNESGTWSYYQPYVWGIPTANVPASGTLNYSLADATAVRYTVASESFSGTLNQFDLAIDLNAASAPSFDVDMAIQVGSAISLSLTPEPVTGTMDGAAFGFDADFEQPNCHGCSLNVVGFLSGANAEQAGVVYKLLRNLSSSDPVGVFTGGAVLDAYVPRL